MTIFTDADFLGTKTSIAAILNDLLGDYIFPENNNAVAKAIAIDISGNYPPKGTIVDIRTTGVVDPTKNGLEVVLRPQLEHSITPLIGRGKGWMVTSEIIFKQWNPFQNVLEAVERVVNEVNLGIDYEVGARQIRNEQIGNIERLIIKYSQPLSYQKID